MAQQYVAADKRTGLEVAVTGEFPPHPDDRVRIARTTTLFTRLMSTILVMSESERRNGFRAVETQLELADALIRQDLDDVRRLVSETMQSLGVTEGQLEDLAHQLRDLGGLEGDRLSDLFGDSGGPLPPGEDAPPPGDSPLPPGEDAPQPGADAPPDDRPSAPEGGSA